jgi:tRNA U34 5-methylaminomethyl-2-thiouridine-forming methyltransferase MnmC
MERKIILTGDGSHTIAIPELKATYHSVHGAIRESQHVFIEAGFWYMPDILKMSGMYILEVGFGTGLNALLTLIEAGKHKRHIHYTAVDLYPLQATEIKPLNYCSQLRLPQYQPLFEKMHQTEWNARHEITDYFRLAKINCDFRDFSAGNPFSLIYFDAFAPSTQPELWTKDVFEKMYSLLLPGGILVTYCSKGAVRRAMQAAGFLVEKIPGPPGKREMLRAIKMAPSRVGRF